MGLLSRIATFLKAKMNAILEGAEDPGETLEYSYEKQLELLRNVKRGIVEVVTSKRRLDLQAARIRDDVNKVDAQARQALASGREDLARLALQRKQVALAQLQGLEGQISDLEQEQDKLTAGEARLSAKVETFRTHKEMVKAQYSAAEAQVRIGEAVTGLSEEMADIGLAIERAEAKTERMQARASAIDELSSAGLLEDLTNRQDPVGSELAKLSAAQNVDAELEAMKRQLESPGTKELEAGR